ncbi:MAG: AAA family ATPase [Steroidobacteraceae bacterium]
MRLLEIETRHWRGLSQSLGPLSPRLNLVLGPNEAGKSRLFQAVQFALFESHKGSAQHKQRLQSWRSSEPPFVRLVFDVEGHRYELQKRFLRNAMAQLSGGGATLQGEEAEAQLRALLGTRPVGSRGPTVQDLGIWPLLLVAQGDSRRGTGEDLNEDGRGRLQERLSQEIGVAAISERGQRLMERVAAERGRYYTPTGQETTLLRNARRAVEEAESKYRQILAAHESREQTAADLQRARTELAELGGRFEAARRESDRAEHSAAAAQRAAERLASARGILSTAIATASSAERELAMRQEADQAIQRLSEEVTALEAQIEAVDPRRQELESHAQTALQRVSAAEQAHKQAVTALERARCERRRRELTDQHAQLSAKSAELERIDRELQQAAQQRAREPAINAGIIAHLQQLADAARTADARLHGAAVSVVLTLGHGMNVDGVPHPAGVRLAFDIVENRTVTLGEVATLEIKPGGGTLGALRDAKVAADTALDEALERCGVPGLPEARAAHERVQDIDQRIAQLTLQAHATWSKSREQLREELLRAQAELARLGPAASVDGTEDALREAVVAADAALTAARTAREVANEGLVQSRAQGAVLRAARKGKAEERDRLVCLYADRPAAAELAEQHRQAVRDRGFAQAAVETCTREFQDLGGEEAARDAKRHAQAMQGLATRVQEARGRVERLTGTLSAALGCGSYETVQDAGAELEQARVRLERLERQAAAAQRLWEVLSEARKHVVDRLTAPVMQRLKPYLASLFPGCELDMGEELGMVGLRSETLSEPFAELSGGAQEQLALLARLGLAEVLAGEGTLPLVLDDSLVNTDPERIRRIHRVLFRAAEKLQVLLLSCHDVLFDGLGAEQVFRLSGSRRAGS